MTDKTFDVSRRTVLAGLGTVGVAAAGAGLGTTALFSDTERFVGNTLTAGTLDLKLDYKATYLGGEGRLDAIQQTYPDAEDLGDGHYLLMEAPTDEDVAEWETLVQGEEFDFCSDEADEYLANGDDIPVFVLDDVKPGDSGEVTISLHICDNPAYVRMIGEITENSENGQTEPELIAEGEDTDGIGELAEYIQVRVWYDEDCDNVYEDAEETIIAEGTMADVFAQLSQDGGVVLDGDRDAEGIQCYPGATTQCVGFEWILPADVGNEVQSDSLTFDVGFEAEQCRHNDLDREIATSTGEGWLKQEEFDQGAESSYARGRFGNNAMNGAWEVGLGEPNQTPVSQANYVWTSGATVPFSYAGDGAGNATFTLDGTAVSGAVPAANGKIGIMAKADEATIDVENVELDLAGDAVTLAGPDAVSASNDGSGRDLQYLLIETAAADLANPFELRGEVTVTLQGDYAGGDEDVAFDVSVE